jgi:hypothetical protein
MVVKRTKPEAQTTTVSQDQILTVVSDDKFWHNGQKCVG